MKDNLRQEILALRARLYESERKISSPKTLFRRQVVQVWLIGRADSTLSHLPWTS